MTVAVPAFAQNTNAFATPYVSTTAAICTNITTTLSYGAHDEGNGDQVTLLQNFLYKRNYLNVSATGYFGSLTRAAVRVFQRENGLAADGVVGVQTRAHIYAKDCGNTPLPTNAPAITAITPTQGPSGTTVTVYGTGFTAHNIVHFAIGSVGTIVAQQGSISFTVPSSIGPYCKPMQACPMYLALINAGTYPISIENENGISNTVQFTVTNNSSVIPQ